MNIIPTVNIVQEFILQILYTVHFTLFYFYVLVEPLTIYFKEKIDPLSTNVAVFPLNMNIMKY